MNSNIERKTRRSRYDTIDTDKLKQCTRCFVFKQKELFISHTQKERKQCDKCRKHRYEWNQQNRQIQQEVK
jgi:hypothetical protein